MPKVSVEAACDGRGKAVRRLGGAGWDGQASAGAAVAEESVAAACPCLGSSAAEKEQREEVGCE